MGFQVVFGQGDSRVMVGLLCQALGGRFVSLSASSLSLEGSEAGKEGRSPDLEQCQFHRGLDVRQPPLTKSAHGIDVVWNEAHMG